MISDFSFFEICPFSTNPYTKVVSYEGQLSIGRFTERGVTDYISTKISEKSLFETLRFTSS